MSETTSPFKVSTDFGSVTENRVTYYYNKGWFNRGSQEDMPLRHITSVRLEWTRHVIGGGILALMAMLYFWVGGAGPKLVSLIAAAFAGLLLWGSPMVIVNTAGGDRRSSKGLPWTKPEAEKFVNALRNQLFKE